MNMKKVLAAVLAVMLAISAMAVTAFADDYTINLSAAKTTAGKAAYSTVEFTIPVWAQYGYAVAGDSITLTLPMVFEEVVDDKGTEDTTDDTVSYVNTTSYAVVANGTTYALGNAVTATAAGVVYGDYEIVFGTLAHGWNPQDGNTVIPQSTIVGDNAALTLIGTYEVEYGADGKESYRVSAADFKYYTDPAQNNWTNSKFTTTFWPTTQHYEVKAVANDLPNAVSYCWDWNPVDGSDIMAADSTTQASMGPLYWDATLTNKAYVLGAETAKIVVKLDRAIVGNYYFGLGAAYADGTWYELGGNFNDLDNDTKPYVAYLEITAPTDTITFDVPKEVLYSAKYGVFNEFVIVDIETGVHEYNIATCEALREGGMTTGTFGKYSWDKDNVYYCGEAINIYWNQWENASVVSVDLVVSTAAEAPSEDIVVEDPVESTEEETEDITVEEPVEDTNPGTGIALAVVPMVLAAAALVASKRR